MENKVSHNGSDGRESSKSKAATKQVKGISENLTKANLTDQRLKLKKDMERELPHTAQALKRTSASRFKDRPDWREKLVTAWHTIRNDFQSVLMRYEHYLPFDVNEVPHALKYLGIGLALVFITAMVGIYGLGWANLYTESVARIIPFPAAYIDGRAVQYRALTDKINQNRFAAKGITKASNASVDYTRASFAALVGDSVVAIYASSHHIVVSDADVTTSLDTYYTGLGGQKAALKNLRTKFGMSKGDYVKVLRSDILRSKVAAALLTDSGNIAVGRARAIAVLAQVEGGSDFAKLANQISPLYSQAGADLSLIPSTFLPHPLQVLAGRLKQGEVYNQVVTLSAPTRFVLIKRESDLNGVVMVRTIIINEPTFDMWLQAKTATAKIEKLMPGLM